MSTSKAKDGSGDGIRRFAKDEVIVYEGTSPKFFANLHAIVSGQVLECWR